MKSVFAKCISWRSILKTDRKIPSILDIRYCTKIQDFCIGPKLNKNSSKEQVAEKIRQLYVYFYIHGVYPNKEKIPLFPNYEKEISKFPFASYVYANYFMKKPWPEAEKSISKDKHASSLYAIHLLKKRFELGEKAISQDPNLCLAYCITIMKRKALPKKMHQAMLLHSLKETTRSTKRYFSFKSVKEIKKETPA